MVTLRLYSQIVFIAMRDLSLTDNDYTRALRGRLVSLLSWDDFDMFWEEIFQNASSDWYVYQIGEQPPEETLSPERFVRFCRRLNNKLKREHEEDYCGIVYVDHKQSPTLIKIYDPNNLGVVCGFSESPPLPGWVISKVKPVDLVAISEDKNKGFSWKKFLPW